MIPIDLHSHSTYSDGSYSVSELLRLCANNGGKYLALTDHDTVDGIAEAITLAPEFNLTLIPGVEISVTWEKSLIHIVGLNLDYTNPSLINNLQLLRKKRVTRAEKISHNLAKIGINGAFNGAMAFCKNPDSISRTHFRHWLVEQGYAKANNAFEKYLAPGKPGYVAETWAALADAIKWITESGGIAIIAHPARYKFTRTKLIRLINEFKSYGGIGIEVISSSHAEKDEKNIAEICKTTQLLASVGSDFHYLETYRTIMIGINKSLPHNLASVFPLLNINLGA